MYKVQRRHTFPYVMMFISTIAVLIVYVVFLIALYCGAYNSSPGASFFFLAALFSSILIFPYFIYRLYLKLGGRYIIYLFFTSVYIFLFVLFAITLLEREKYRFFDPFLQMSPPMHKGMLMPPDSTELRILMMGGSSTRCASLPEEYRTSQVLKEKLSAEFPGKKVSVYNGGMDWFTTRHSLTAYIIYYRLFKPDVVVMTHGINDLVRSFTPLQYSSPVFKYDYTHFFGAASHAAIPQPNAISRYIQLADLFWHQKIMQKKDTVIDFSSDAYKSINSYSYFYKALIEQVKAEGAIPVIVSEPTIYNANMSSKEEASLWFAHTFCFNQTENNYRSYGKRIASLSSMTRAMTLFNNKAFNLAKENGAFYLPLDSLMPKTEVFISDDVHLTIAGAEKAAGALSQIITSILRSHSKDNSHKTN